MKALRIEGATSPKWSYEDAIAALPGDVRDLLENYVDLQCYEVMAPSPAVADAGNAAAEALLNRLADLCAAEARWHALPDDVRGAARVSAAGPRA